MGRKIINEYPSRSGGASHTIQEDDAGNLICTGCKAGEHGYVCWALKLEQEKRFYEKVVDSVFPYRGLTSKQLEEWRKEHWRTQEQKRKEYEAFQHEQFLKGENSIEPLLKNQYYEKPWYEEGVGLFKQSCNG